MKRLLPFIVVIPIVILAFSMMGAHAEAARHRTTTYTITASARTGGSISPSGTVKVRKGASQTFTITAQAGYAVSKVVIDGVSVGAVTSYTFANVTSSHKIIARFATSVTPPPPPPPPPAGTYPLHSNISTTYFWCGEDASADNSYITNVVSAWDEAWGTHFGGVDDPFNRNGYLPAAFTPKENPFYFALPYDDFDNNGNRRANVTSIYWWESKTWGASESACKNQWIAIIKDGKTCYAQWEDVGPYSENDVNYVFGSATPTSSENNHAGLDVSPAVKDYLNLADVDKVSWQFVDASAVPPGPWTEIITTSQIYWR